MEFRDSTSSQPLLRYATSNVIEQGDNEGIRESLDRMVAKLDIAAALGGAGPGDAIRPGCQGTLAERGRQAAEAARAARATAQP